MNKRIAELKAKARGLVEAMRALLDKAEVEKRELTAEESAQYSKIETDFNSARDMAEKLEKQAAIEASLSAPAGDPIKPAVGGDGNRDEKAEKEQRSAFCAFLRGDLSVNAPELRALQADSGAAGGALILPQALAGMLIKALDDEVFIRRLATKHGIITAASLGIPTLEADPADADWTSEVATGSEDSTMSFGKRELKPWPLAKRLKVSNKLLRLAPSVDSLVMARLAYKFGISEEKAFMTGSGAEQPLGLFIASNDGIPTTRDMSTGNTATSIQTDGLINAKYTLKSGYWARAAWIFHRDALKQIAKLKDGNGQYLWQPSIQAGQPDQLLSFPINMSEYAPNTFTAGLYVGMLADYSFYHIVDALDMTVQRLTELYAETNKTGFIGRKETDGMPVLAEAFVRVKLA